VQTGCNRALTAKADALRQHIRQFASAALAFSAGVDSALLAYLGAQELGDKFIALTVNSPLLLKGDLEESVHFCKTHEIQHRVLEMDILSDFNFSANDEQRCYYCKQRIFSTIRDYADRHGFEQIMDGSNSDDCPLRRPGMRVLAEQGIQSPLRECAFTKADIRELSRELGLSTWNKESDSCRATRIPHGTAITTASLHDIA